MSRTNCLVWAVRMWWRLWLKGYEPYLTARGSRLEPRWGPHFSVALRLPSGRVRFVGWKPDDTSPLPWWRLWKALYTHGRVHWGDEP